MQQVQWWTGLSIPVRIQSHQASPHTPTVVDWAVNACTDPTTSSLTTHTHSDGLGCQWLHGSNHIKPHHIHPQWWTGLLMPVRIQPHQAPPRTPTREAILFQMTQGTALQWMASLVYGWWRLRWLRPCLYFQLSLLLATRSVPEVHLLVAWSLSNRPTNERTNERTNSLSNHWR